MTIEPATTLPSALTSLQKKLTPDWTQRITPGQGYVTESYYGAPRSNGTRPTLTRQRPCASVALRLRHADGRAAIGIWSAPLGYEPSGSLGKRWHATTGKVGKLRPALLVLADPAAVALLSVLLRWGPCSYAFATAFAWTVCTDPACELAGTDHPDDLPRQLDSAALRLYVAAANHAVYAAGLEGLRARKAVTAAKAAATRAARRTTTDISDSVPTDEQEEAA